jgi:hypothetical protein
MSSSGPASQANKANPKQTVLTFFITLTIFSLVAYFTFFPLRPSRILRRLHRKLPKPFYRLGGRVSNALQPLLVHFAAPTDLAVAIRSFSDYSFAQQAALDAKWRSFERMGKRHRRLGQHLGWRGKLESVEGKLDANSRVTDELAALGMEKARKEGVPLGLGMRSRFARQDGRVVEVSPSIDDSGSLSALTALLSAHRFSSISCATGAQKGRVSATPSFLRFWMRSRKNSRCAMEPGR